MGMGMVGNPNDDALFTLIQTLTELPGPTGHEDAVQDWIADRWSSLGEVRRTNVGNVLVRVGGRGPRLVLVAHADEICLVIKSVSDEGHCFVWPYYADRLGAPPRWFMPASQPVLVVTGTGTVPAIIATASGHVVGGQSSRKERLEWNDLFVDLGVESRADVEALGIHPGCRVIWNPPTRRLGPHRITGKAMDDRVALAIATLVGEHLAGRDDLTHEVWLASTIQEENGLIGASSLADEERFDRCIAIDVGLTGDIPGPDRRDFPGRLGAGPMLVHQDSSTHYSGRFIRELVAAAASAGIPIQQAIFQNFGSDGAEAMRRGMETALLTYPTRYTHSPIETVDEADVRACVDLIVAFAVESRGARVH